MRVAVLFANGTEEIEGLTPVDVLRRAGAACDIVSVSGEYPQGSHGITVRADKTVEEIDLLCYDAIVIPGGMPGATNIAANAKVVAALKEFFKAGKTVAAICASPAVVLASNGLIDGKKATCYPAEAFVKMMNVCEFTGKNVQVDGNLITANGPKSAMEFSLKICELLKINPAF